MTEPAVCRQRYIGGMMTNEALTGRRTMKSASSNKKAEAAYNTAISNACWALEQIKAGMTAHANDQKAGGNWGHVGDMNHLAARLQELADQLNGTGEYAEPADGGWVITPAE